MWVRMQDGTLVNLGQAEAVGWYAIKGKQPHAVVADVPTQPRPVVIARFADQARAVELVKVIFLHLAKRAAAFDVRQWLKRRAADEAPLKLDDEE